VLGRDRLLVIAALVAVLGLAWGWLLTGAGMEMSAVEMTAMAGMDGWMMQPAVWTASYALLMFAMWWVMMIAMMLPSASPMLLLFSKVISKDKAAPEALTGTVLFSLGYVLVWGAFSALATLLQWLLQSMRWMSPMMETSHRWLGVAILVAAGLWQLTPVKRVCLSHCRSPLSFLVGHWRRGQFGALRMGLTHGVFCLGCCWFLMALLFFGGVMNLYWIAGLAIFVLLEKALPLGHVLGRWLGVALISWGIMLAI
jgi:predicted metal-binding membrane protein